MPSWSHQTVWLIFLQKVIDNEIRSINWLLNIRNLIAQATSRKNNFFVGQKKTKTKQLPLTFWSCVMRQTNVINPQMYSKFFFIFVVDTLKYFSKKLNFQTFFVVVLSQVQLFDWLDCVRELYFTNNFSFLLLKSCCNNINIFFFTLASTSYTLLFIFSTRRIFNCN